MQDDTLQVQAEDPEILDVQTREPPPNVIENPPVQTDPSPILDDNQVQEEDPTPMLDDGHLVQAVTPSVLGGQPQDPKPSSSNQCCEDSTSYESNLPFSFLIGDVVNVNNTIFRIVDVNVAANVDVNANVPANVDVNANVPANVDVNANVAANVDVNANAEAGVDVKANADVTFNTNTLVDVNDNDAAKADVNGNVLIVERLQTSSPLVQMDHNYAANPAPESPTKDKVRHLKKKVKRLQDQLRYKKKKVKHLEDILEEMKEKKKINSNCSDLLSEQFSGIPLEILSQIVFDSSSSSNTPSLEVISPEPAWIFPGCIQRAGTVG